MNKRKKCPLCNTNSFKLIEKVNINNSKLSSFIESNYKMGDFLKANNYFYELRYCKSCGSRYQVNVLEDKESKNFYSKSIKANRSFLKQLFNYKKNFFIRKKTAKLIKNLLKSKEDKIYKALEVGAGWGFFSHLSKDFNLDFTTLEISDERREFHSFLKLKNIANFNQALINGYKFDLIYSNQVLEHISDLGKFMDNCKKLLVINGYFIAEYPSYNNYFHYLFKRKSFYNDKRTKTLEHLQLISDSGIRKLLDSTDAFEYSDKLPIRKFGDRIKIFFQMLTPLKFRGSGFIVAKRIK